MSPQLEKRRRVMQRSIALGHCVCDVKQPCPCEIFKQRGICQCAGERIPAGEGPVRLTEHVRNAGCASKISKNILQEVLADLPQFDDGRVVVGAAAGDDAGVVMISPETASILTVDVFCPSVDDPYTFGQIAAANSLSDIYAMGGTPQAALSIVGYPIHALPASAMREILRGGIEKMREAGVPVVGGHSINDSEVKGGFAVIGTCPPGRFIRNAGAQAGDAIVLTKPLGTGIVAFAHQVGLTLPGVMESAARSMAQLNRRAGELMVRHGAHAATDITGFSLIGHLAEIVRNSGVEVEVDFDRVPALRGAADLAERDVLPGAVDRNRESVDEGMLELSKLTSGQQAMLFGPETSGGLLVFLPPERAEVYVQELRAGEESAAAIVGRVMGRREGGMIRVVVSEQRPEGYYSADLGRKGNHAKPQAATVELPPCCQEHTAEGIPPKQEGSNGHPGADGALPAPAGQEVFKTYMGTVSAAGAIDLKTKKLMSLALSVMSRCEGCVKANIKAAREAGASEEELAEAVSLAIAFGGAPVGMFYGGMRRQ